MLSLLVGLNIFGRENLPDDLNKRDQPFIMIANHNSHLDAFTLMNLFSLKDFHYVKPVAAADYFMKNPVLAWFSTTILNIIPIPRSNITKENNPITAMTQALEAGHSLIIFPEGSRGEPEVMQEFKSGVAHLIKKHPDTPVIPVFLKGMGRALPKGEMVIVPFFCDVIIGTPKLYAKADKAIDKASITTALSDDICQLKDTLCGFFENDKALPSEDSSSSTHDFGWQWVSNELFTATRQWADSTQIPFVLGAWAFCESIFWFILPDFLLFPMCIQAPSRWKQFCIFTISGSVIGMVVMMALCHFSPDFINSYLFNLPFTPITMEASIITTFEKAPFWAPLTQAVSGIPVKVWTSTATQFHLQSIPLFITLVLISRSIRILLVALTGHLLSKWLGKNLKRLWFLFIVAYLILFFWTMNRLAYS